MALKPEAVKQVLVNIESFVINEHLIFLLAVPQVLKSCTEFIEKHGVVDGIYRLSGIASNIQKLRYETHAHTASLLTVFYASIYQVALGTGIVKAKKKIFHSSSLNEIKCMLVSKTNSPPPQTFKDLVIGPVIFVFAMLNCYVCMCNAVYM